MGSGSWSLCCWGLLQVWPLKEVRPMLGDVRMPQVLPPIQLGDGENPKMSLGRLPQECFPIFKTIE